MVLMMCDHNKVKQMFGDVIISLFLLLYSLMAVMKGFIDDFHIFFLSVFFIYQL